MRTLTQVRILLRAEIKRAGGVEKWARRIGTSEMHVNGVLSGDVLPDNVVLRALKLRCVVRYVMIRS